MSVTSINIDNPTPVSSPKAKDNAEKSEEGMSFLDFLDIINPLQHIPVVSTIYRSLTGDELKNFPRVVGGALFGGPIGLVTSAISAIVKDETGKDPGEHALAWLSEDDAPAPAPAPEENKLAALTPEAEAAPKEKAKIAAQAPVTQANLPPATQRLVDEGKFMPLNPASFNPNPPEMPKMMPTSKVGAVRPGSGQGFMPVNPGQPRYFPVASDVQVQRAAAAQGLGQSQHPLLANRDQAFLSQSMMEAAEKYRRMGAIGSKGGEF